MPKHLYAISRTDDAGAHKHGWLVFLGRRGQVHAKYFSDKRYGGQKASLRAATAYRDQLDESIPRPTRAEVSRTLRKGNKSGISGVYRLERADAKGRVYPAWKATWPTEIGVQKSKQFSVARHGEKGARALALQAREQGLQALEDQLYVKRATEKRRKRPKTTADRIWVKCNVTTEISEWLGKQASKRGVSRSAFIGQIIQAAKAGSGRK